MAASHKGQSKVKFIENKHRRLVISLQKVTELRYCERAEEEDGQTDRQNCCRWNRETRTRKRAVESDALLLGCVE